MWLEHFTIIVDDYDRAIGFFTGALGFELAEDSPALATRGGRPKRRVVVRRPGARTGVLLAQAGVQVASGKFWSDIAEPRLCAFGGRALVSATTVRTGLPVRGWGSRWQLGRSPRSNWSSCA